MVFYLWTGDSSWRASRQFDTHRFRIISMYTYNISCTEDVTFSTVCLYCLRTPWSSWTASFNSGSYSWPALLVPSMGRIFVSSTTQIAFRLYRPHAANQILYRLYTCVYRVTISLGNSYFYNRVGRFLGTFF